MHIFLDESGKPEVFSAKGLNLVEKGFATEHLVIAVVKTADQLVLQQNITDFRAALLKDEDVVDKLSAAYALDAFHANKDFEVVRQKFYTHIAALDGIEIHVIVAEKLGVEETLKENPVKFYGHLSGLILQGICHQDSEAEIIFSRQDNGKLVKKELELEVERIRQNAWSKHKKQKDRKEKLNLVYQHNPHYSHGGLQIADYVAYAVFQYYEFDKKDYLEIILPKIRHLHDYKQRKHFTRSRPFELS